MAFIVGYLLGTAVVLLMLKQTQVWRAFYRRLSGQANYSMFIELCCEKHANEFVGKMQQWAKEMDADVHGA